MARKPYGIICPITHACAYLEPRWTLQILSEMWAGASRFNDIRRGIGNISPGLLSRRLKEMEAKGLIERIEDRATVFNWDRGMDLEAVTPEAQRIVDLLADGLAEHIYGV